MRIPRLYEERTITVFVARGGKKFFTRDAARRRGAWDLIKTRCECHVDELECPDGSAVTYGNFVRCKYHAAFDGYEDRESEHHGLVLAGKLIARAKREELRRKKAERAAKRLVRMWRRKLGGAPFSGIDRSDVPTLAVTLNGSASAEDVLACIHCVLGNPTEGAL